MKLVITKAKVKKAGQIKSKAKKCAVKSLVYSDEQSTSKTQPQCIFST